jgi:hypothetical protein
LGDEHREFPCYDIRDRERFPGVHRLFHYDNDNVKVGRCVMSDFPTEFYLGKGMRQDGSAYFTILTTHEDAAEWFSYDWRKANQEVRLWKVTLERAVELELIPPVPASLRVKTSATLPLYPQNEVEKEKDE